MFNFKKILAGGAVAATIFASTALPAFASGKAPLYGPINNTFTCPTGGANTGLEYGRVIMSRESNGQLETTVVLRGALANTTYDVYINQDPGGCPTTPTGSLTTNSNGNAYAQFLKYLVPGATNFWVSAVGGTQVLRSPAVGI